MKRKNDNEKNQSSSFKHFTRRTIIVLACIFAVLIILCGVLIGAFFAMRTFGRLSMENRREENISGDYGYDENVVHFDGRSYRYNSDLSVLLFIGVDRATRSGHTVDEDLGDKLSEGVSGASQADVLLLLVVDEKNKKADVISIDRNSMVYFESYDAEGNSIGSLESQIAFSYSYGDSKHKSCRMTMDAVSSFMYDIPIHAYYSMELRSIRHITDAVGGVKVTVPVDMTSVDASFEEGAEVVLSGTLAEKFLRARSELEDASNAGRMSRHEMFLRSFFVSAVNAAKKDISVVPAIYNKIAKTSFTDITLDEAVYFADLAADLDISFHSIKGTTLANGKYDEFRADQKALYGLVLDIFYICED